MENFREDRSMSENRTFRAHLHVNNTPFVVTDCTCTSPSIRASVRSGDATTHVASRRPTHVRGHATVGDTAPLLFGQNGPQKCVRYASHHSDTDTALSVCGVEEKADRTVRTCVLSIDRAERQNGDGCVRAMQADLSRNYLIRPKRGWRAWE